MINRKEHIFLTWKRIASHKARAVRLLQHNLRKNLLQYGLDCIFVYQRRKGKLLNLRKKMMQIIVDYEDGRKRLALTIWKRKYFELVKELTQQAASDNHHAKLNGQYQRTDIR